LKTDGVSISSAAIPITSGTAPREEQGGLRADRADQNVRRADAA
jgi:hypothetical protein